MFGITNPSYYLSEQTCDYFHKISDKFLQDDLCLDFRFLNLRINENIFFLDI